MKRIVLVFIMCWSGVILSAAEDVVKSYVDVLNLRDSPSTDGKVLYSIGRNSKIELLFAENEFSVIDSVKSKWYKVRVDKDKIGWIFAGFVSGKKDAPYSVNEIIGRWDILENDGIGEVSFIFKDHGKLELRAIGKNEYSDDCQWIYNNIDDTIEILLHKEKWSYELKLLKENLNKIADNNMYRKIDVDLKIVEIKINRSNSGFLSFTFMGYNVNKNPR